MRDDRGGAVSCKRQVRIKGPGYDTAPIGRHHRSNFNGGSFFGESILAGVNAGYLSWDLLGWGYNAVVLEGHHYVVESTLPARIQTAVWRSAMRHPAARAVVATLPSLPPLAVAWTTHIHSPSYARATCRLIECRPTQPPLEARHARISPRPATDTAADRQLTMTISDPIMDEVAHPGFGDVVSLCVKGGGPFRDDGSDAACWLSASDDLAFVGQGGGGLTIPANDPMFENWTSFARTEARYICGSGEIDTSEVDGATCSGRIRWLIKHEGRSELEARAAAAAEFPSTCGECVDVPPPPSTPPLLPPPLIPPGPFSPPMPAFAPAPPPLPPGARLELTTYCVLHTTCYLHYLLLTSCGAAPLLPATYHSLFSPFSLLCATHHGATHHGATYHGAPYCRQTRASSSRRTSARRFSSSPPQSGNTLDSTTRQPTAAT